MSKQRGIFFQIFAAFPEYPNFNTSEMIVWDQLFVYLKKKKSCINYETTFLFDTLISFSISFQNIKVFSVL